MKYLGQLLAAFLYTSLFTGIMYLIITIPLAFVISLPWWGMLLIILIGGGILEGLIEILGTLGLIPYAWITDNNMLATWISIIIAVLNVGINIYHLWAFLLGQGTWAIIFGVVATALLLQFIYKIVVGIVIAKNKEQLS